MSPSLKAGRKTIRVVVAEDQGMVLGALATLLEIEGDITVVARPKRSASTGCGADAQTRDFPHRY